MTVLTTNWTVLFDPLIGWTWIWAGLALAAALTLYSLWRGLRGAALRGLGLALLLAVLSRPLLVEENREPVKDIAVVVVDDSDSQKIGDRTAVTQTAVKQLQAELDKYPDLETRVVEAGSTRDGEDVGTALFSRLDRALLDIDETRLAGAILVTDGQVHDVPARPGRARPEAKAGPDADSPVLHLPVHGLITGKEKALDRKLTILQAPRFGIVGEPLNLVVRIDDLGGEDPSTAFPADVDVRIDGETVFHNRLTTGAEHTIPVDLPHGGENVVQIEVEPLDGELTRLNNQAAVVINGIRDRLRVLLVSGEPHAGERVWRNLLKSDPSVDLVHFTILRPPEKQDGTPIGELSLIAFPTRQLFSIKLHEFDLIIFDRFRRRGVLPLLYLNNVAEYVEQGGALLTAVGPPFATPYSLYRTPLAAVLPARPTGDIIEKGFKPHLTLDGRRHPVTTGLDKLNPPPPGDKSGEPGWGRWFRLIDSTPIGGKVLMSGPEDKPLLVLDRVGEGRVAELMSDHAWLWARGYEGGGPQAELLRRLAHWLMKEPDLEEEVLRGESQGRTLVISRRTMSDHVNPVTLTAPSGATQTITLKKSQEGLWKGTAEAQEFGLYHLDDGQKKAVVAVGPLNPKEFEDVRAAGKLLAPIADYTGGSVHWLSPRSGKPEDVHLPEIRRVRPGHDAAGRDWIGLVRNERFKVTSLSDTPLILAPLALLFLAIALLVAWYREGRA